MTDTTTTEVATTEDMTAEEGQLLLELERRIAMAMRSAGRVAGPALREIRDKRLYRASHRSFEQYVYDRFDGMSKSAAYRMIADEPTNGLSPAAAAIGRASAKATERRHVTLDQPPTTIDPDTEEMAPRPPERPKKDEDERVAPKLPEGRLTPPSPFPTTARVASERPGAGRPTIPGGEIDRKRKAREQLNRIMAVLDMADLADLAIVSNRRERTVITKLAAAVVVEERKANRPEGVVTPEHCDHPVNRIVGDQCGKCGARRKGARPR